MSKMDEQEVAKDGDVYQPRINEYTQKFINDINEERERLSEDFPLCALLIEEAIERAYSAGRIPGKEFHADVFKQKPLKVTQKVFVPVKQFPKFNFSGKILGPKGNSLRRLQDETQCKIAIKGRHSTRDIAKEEELRNSGDPKYAHFNKPLFLEISTVAPPAEAYARVAYALAEIRKYIIPDKNDDISQEQLREIMEIDPEATKNMANKPYKSFLPKKPFNGTNGAAKYQSYYVKKTPYDTGMQTQEYEEEYSYEQEPEMYEYAKPYHPKRVPMYQYGKVAPYKRAQPTMYATATKRLREAPETASPYKASPYSMSLKKYK